MSNNRLIRDEDDEASPSPSTQTSPLQAAETKKGGRGPYPGKRQVTAHIDEALYKWLRSMSVQIDKPMVAMFEEALTSYVQKFAAQKRFSAPET